jgi:small multidrug resistance family-3 protein
VSIFRVLGLFVLTTLAEIVGYHLPYLWLRRGGSLWLFIPGAVSLAAFTWGHRIVPLSLD